MDTGHIEKVLYLCIQGADHHEQIGDVVCSSLMLYVKVIFNEIDTSILSYSMARPTPDLFIEYLTQNLIFHVKSHVTKHVF